MNYLEPQAHGGALHRGGTKGKSGRRPGALKKLARKMLAERMPMIGHIADGTSLEWLPNGEQALRSPSDSERLAAIKLLKEIGDVNQVPVADVKARLRAQFVCVRQMLPADQAEPLCRALLDLWR